VLRCIGRPPTATRPIQRAQAKYRAAWQLARAVMQNARSKQHLLGTPDGMSSV
jgi:hypothetical protein